MFSFFIADTRNRPNSLAPNGGTVRSMCSEKLFCFSSEFNET